ncbi:T9SS type A sorting domain-containing protein [bacterium SCSIO 12741]|nr:T9SS type A sorting domain-containing protein [bacterium SCSIO 12741]
MKRLIPALLLLFIGQSVFAQMQGNYLVGNGATDDFSCLTCPGGAFRALDSIGMSGDVTFLIRTDLLKETGAYNLEAFPAPHELRIAPAAAAMVRIQQTSSTPRELIDIKGADRVTIDGSFQGMGRYLTFRSGQNFPVIQYKLDCEDNVLENCVIESNNSSTLSATGGAVLVKSTSGTGSDRLSIQNNLIQSINSSRDLMIGIYVQAPSLANEHMDRLRIVDNQLENVQYRTIYLADQSGTVNAAVIEGNRIMAPAGMMGNTAGGTLSMIYVNTGTGHRISKNHLGGGILQKMQVSLPAASSTCHFIRLGRGVSGNLPVHIDSNIIRDVSIAGPTTQAMEVSLFRVEPLVDNPIELHFNEVGRDNIQILTPNQASLLVHEGFNSADNRFRVMDLEPEQTVRVSLNNIGGILMEKTANPLGTKVKLIEINEASQVWFNNNTIGRLAHNIVKNSDGDLIMIQSNCPISILHNHFSGVTCKDDFSSDFKAVFTYPLSGSVKVINNAFGLRNKDISADYFMEFNNSGSAQSNVRMIEVSGTQVDSVIVRNNIIASARTQSSSLNERTDFQGIYVHVAVDEWLQVNANRVSFDEYKGIKLAAPGDFHGILLENMACPKVMVDSNEMGIISLDAMNQASFRGIELEEATNGGSHCQVNYNEIGQSLTSHAITLQGTQKTSNPVSRGIYLHGDMSTARILFNQISGITTSSADTTDVPLSAIEVLGTTDSLEITRNQVGEFGGYSTLNMTSSFYDRGLLYANPAATCSDVGIRSNTFKGIRYKLNKQATVSVLKVKAASPVPVDLHGNIVKDVELEGSIGTVEVNGINLDAGNTEILNNEVNDWLLEGNNYTIRFNGMSLESDSGSHVLSNNRVYDIQSSSSQGKLKASTRGFLISGGNATVDFSRNRVYDYRFDNTSFESSFRGIHVSSTEEGQFYNNVVLYNQGTGQDVEAYGLYDQLKTGEIRWTHNTIYLKGEQDSVVGRTACYFGQNRGDRYLYNNFFCNEIQGGPNPHYCLFFTESNIPRESDFNALHTVDDITETIYRNGTSFPLKFWWGQGFDEHSINPYPQALLDTATGKPLTKLGLDKGSSATGINTDIDGQVRPLYAGPDLGAYESDSTGLQEGILSIKHQSHAQKGWKCYPNPTSGMIYLGETVDVEILDLHGRVLKTVHQSDRLDLSDLSAGVYLLKKEEAVFRVEKRD